MRKDLNKEQNARKHKEEICNAQRPSRKLP